MRERGSKSKSTYIKEEGKNWGQVKVLKHIQLENEHEPGFLFL